MPRINLHVNPKNAHAEKLLLPLFYKPKNPPAGTELFLALVRRESKHNAWERHPSEICSQGQGEKKQRKMHSWLEWRLTVPGRWLVSWLLEQGWGSQHLEERLGQWGAETRRLFLPLASALRAQRRVPAQPRGGPRSGFWKLRPQTCCLLVPILEGHAIPTSMRLHRVMWKINTEIREIWQRKSSLPSTFNYTGSTSGDFGKFD